MNCSLLRRNHSHQTMFHPIQTSYYDPAKHTHYIEPRTTGEIMLSKLGYRESVEEYTMYGNPSKNKRILKNEQQNS